MRLIDADALYASIAKDTYLLTDRINSRDYGMFLVGIKKKIDNAPTLSAEAVQGWIPCSERLPDTDIPVLVSDGVYVWEDELQEDYEDSKTMYWWDSQCSFDFNDTAWMPKPKPYKGGDTE